MLQSLAELQQRREATAQQIAQLGDFRPGSITNTSGRCGKPSCHCHQAGQPGHGPNLRLDRKSTRLNSSHLGISYAVSCLKKETTNARPRAFQPILTGRSVTLSLTCST